MGLDGDSIGRDTMNLPVDAMRLQALRCQANPQF